MTIATAFQASAFQSNAFQIVGVTSTNVLQLPVDYALAGDQEEYRHRGLPVRSGRLSGKAMRRAFNE